MSTIERKYVIPGDTIIEGDYRPLINAIKRNNRIISTRIGMAEIVRKDVRVIPLNGTYYPRLDDTVIGIVADSNAFVWEVDINSVFFGILQGSAVLGRTFSASRDSLSSHFKTGDCLITKIASFDRTRDPLLSIYGPGLGKVSNGEICKISMAQVPRLIGKKGAMIKLIEENTKCKLNIGQNGVIFINGEKESIVKIKKVINIIEKQAYLPDLNDKVNDLLK